MYDKLVKRLRETSVDFGESDHVSVMMIEAANAIEKLWKLFQSAEKDNAKLTAWYVEKCNKHKWIPVTERLPEDRKMVLATVDGVMRVAFYGNYMWEEVETYSIFYPTHWMPLPQPPESEDE